MKKVDIQAIRRVPSAIKRIPYKKVLFGVVGLLVFTTIAYGASYKFYFKNCRYVYSKTCALKDAAGNLSPEKSDKLNEVVAKIKKIDGYETDQDLLYVVFKYQYNTGDSSAAKTTLEKLNKAYDNQKGYDKIIYDKAESPKELTKQIEFIDQFEQDIKNNTTGIPIDVQR